jgi:hypothetical protein
MLDTPPGREASFPDTDGTKQMKRIVAGLVFYMLFGSAANAALYSRLGGQAYYDSTLNITWLANANLADTNDFGIGGVGFNGAMSWDAANDWVAAMNTAAYLGASDWRLPLMTDTAAPGCDFGYTGTDCGYNVQTKSGSTVYSEMAHLFYVTLGNTGLHDTGGNLIGCAGFPDFCLGNAGPFANLQANYYWTGTAYAPDAGKAWYFNFGSSSQYPEPRASELYAWAVRPGDIAAVPVPGAVWLFGGSLALLGAVRRRTH